MSREGILAYENALVMKPLCEALQGMCEGEEFVIYRQPFRWKRYNGDYLNGEVLPNCYEMFSLKSVLEEKGYECIYNFEHAAIVKQQTNL